MNLTLVHVIFLLSISVSLVHLNPITDGPSDCLKCHKIDKDKINVHLVPHSHVEVGWFETADQYYYGDLSKASVQYIITSVVDALSANSERRFIQVETAFFWKWWQEQSEFRRETFKKLVDNGQIEIVNGAWSMNDEACTNYQSIIDQFTWGLKVLKQTVGSCGTPRVGWQIDSFGHSREQASIFAQLGYDGVFFASLDHADRDNRQKKQSLEFAWQGSANIPNKTIFGGIFPTSSYNSPNGFCWDYTCNDENIVDNPESSEYNLYHKVPIFSDLIQNYSTYYKTKNILIPMGGNFHFSAAERNFINMDRLIKAYKNDSKLNVIYSTPSCYIKAVNEAKPTLPLKTDDFFPYSDTSHSFWSGYFTSRPTNKRFERIGHNILQVVKQLFAINAFNGGDNYENSLTDLREVMGTLQHHNAITGTNTQQVANDYVKQLTKAIEEAEKPIGEIIGNLTGDKNITLDIASCLLSNISICTSQNAEKFVVVVYNPLSWPVTHYIRLPIDDTKVTVRGPDGFEKCDIVPTFGNFDFVELPQTPSSNEIVFAATKIPAFGFKMYFVEKTSNETINCKQAKSTNTFSFGTKNANFVINEKTNLLKSVTLNGKSVEITQNFFYYQSATPSKNNNFKSSGAYIFCPNSSTPFLVSDKVDKINAFLGNIVDEFHQEWTSDLMKVRQSIRVYKNEGFIEFDWIVGNILYDYRTMGVEVITKFLVGENFDNNNVFYTDANGREMFKRILNQRPDYEHNINEEPVASNYYPVTSKIVIQDLKKNLEVGVMNDRAQGGSSLNKGEIELMVHRRILLDDNKGLVQPLSEIEFGSGLYVRGSHYLVLGEVENAVGVGLSTAAQERILAQQKLLQPWIGVAPTHLTYKELEHSIKTPFEPLEMGQVPKGINILTLEPWGQDNYLLRLEHFLEKNDDKELSAAKRVNLMKLFKNTSITDTKETVLGANQLLDDFKKTEKYTWTTSGTPIEVAKIEADPSKYEISLSPMEIRTFIVKFQKNPIS